MSLPDALLASFARHLGLPPEAARPALQALFDGLRARLDADGAAALEGVGRFRRDGGDLAFEADPALLAAVNAPFAGLLPIAPPPPPPPAVAPDEEPETADEPEEDAEEPAPALFSVPLESGPYPEEDEELSAPGFDDSEVSHPPPSTEPDDAPIAPLPTAPDVAGEAEPEAAAETVEDAFASPDEPPAVEPEPEPVPPVRDLSSVPEDEGAEDETAEAGGAEDETAEDEGEPLDHPIAVPFAPAGELPEADEDGRPHASGEAPPAPDPTDGEPGRAVEEAPAVEDEETDDDLEALLAGVWTPSPPPAPEHPLGPASEPLIEDAEYDVVDDGETDEPTPEPPATPDEVEEPAIPEIETPSEPAGAFGGPAEETTVAAAIEEPEAGGPAAEEPEDEESPVEVPASVISAVGAAGVAAPVTETPMPPPPVAPPAVPGVRPGAGASPPGTGALPPRPALGERRPARTTERTPSGRRVREGAGRRSWGAARWLPVLLGLLLVLLLVLLWPTLTGRPSDEPGAVVPPAVPAGPAPATPDSAALAAATPADSAEAAPARPEPTPPAEAPAADGAIPAPLLGPGTVDPARGGATWVLGSVGRPDAEALAARYREQGYRASALRGVAGGRTVYRVAVGQFASFEEAHRFRSALPPGAPSNAWVLRLE